MERQWGAGLQQGESDKEISAGLVQIPITGGQGEGTDAFARGVGIG